MKLSMICTICTPLNTASTGKEREKPKNRAQMRHSCTLSGREQPQEPFASTSSPSPSLMEKRLGGEARHNCDNPVRNLSLTLPLTPGIGIFQVIS
jgi:hypothetical protein